MTGHKIRINHFVLCLFQAEILSTFTDHSELLDNNNIANDDTNDVYVEAGEELFPHFPHQIHHEHHSSPPKLIGPSLPSNRIPQENKNRTPLPFTSFSHLQHLAESAMQDASGSAPVLNVLNPRPFHANQAMSSIESLNSHRSAQLNTPEVNYHNSGYY